MLGRDFDVIVVGGGHAGVEAALAVARMGRTAALVTMDASKLALMSCNPAIGGIGKSQLVKEIDALGGLMAKAIDATGIQFRRLNLSRGPAVWSTRAQADRIAYNRYVVDFVAAEPNVEVIEALAGAILTENGRVSGILTEGGDKIAGRAVIIASGTFLGGLIHIGEKKIRAGRIGEPAAYKLSDSLFELGFEVGRLKTGTPPRLDGATIDWSRCELQPGEQPIPFFTHSDARLPFEQTPCHLTHTTEATKDVVAANFTRSPIFSGQIESRGPRYCPSIEDKYFRFSDKPTHHIFLEPEGNGTNEIYPNGFSTALPEEIQKQAIRTVVGLEQVEVTRPGYAVEYDYCPAHQIERSLQTRRLLGLFFAGQINGTSGYEEAGAQGLMAGVNAVLYLDAAPPFILDRSEAYIGVMIDDLTTRSTTEPYRMFTSRAEYRLALREDNARDRLYEYARRYGLIPQSDYDNYRQLEARTQERIAALSSTWLNTSDLGDLANRFQKRERISLADLFRQPGLELADLMPIVARFNGRFSGDREIMERASVRIRYQGYIEKQQREIDKFRRQERELVPSDFPFDRVSGLRNEAREKFVRFRPASLGQAGRIEGVTAGDLAVLAVSLKRFKAAKAS